VERVNVRKKDTPLVSVIIPTYNSARTLSLALRSIKRQTYPSVEIIVVDRYSRDGTPHIASRFGARLIQADTERAEAKNIGLKAAKGQYVLFLDSDMELTPTVIQECVELVERNSAIGAVIIPEITVGNSLVAKIRRYERLHYENTYIESPRFYRKDLAIQAGGFDPEVVFYEEATLAYKIEKMGYRKVRSKSYILHHEEDLSLMELIRKRYYYAHTLRIYATRYREYADVQLNPSYRLRLFFKRSFWKYPHIALAVIIVKSLEYLSISLATLRK
jgi:glycosyltransferase involved in cell wall biosynthesis